MEYKKFGIYTDKQYVYIVINIKDNSLTGIKFKSEFFCELSNQEVNNWINDWLMMFIEDTEDGEIFIIDLNKNSNLFNDNGYLGLIRPEYHRILESQLEIMSEEGT